MTNRDSPSLEKYLQEIGKIDLPTPEEEWELVKRIKQGDQAALEKLTKANLRFVVSVAKQYQYQWLELSDLINEGNIWLIKAASRFDATRWFRFISYAVRWIRQAILESIQNNWRIVRRPQMKKRWTINTMFKELLNKWYTPSAEALLDSFKITNPDISAWDIEKYLNGYNQGRDVSLNNPSGSDDPTEFIDLLPAPDNQIAIWLEAVKKDTLEEIVNLLFSNPIPWDVTVNHTGQQKKCIDTKNQKQTNKMNKLKDILKRYWGIAPYYIAESEEEIVDNLNSSPTKVKNMLEFIKKMIHLSLNRSSVFYNEELYTLLKDHNF